MTEEKKFVFRASLVCTNCLHKWNVDVERGLRLFQRRGYDDGVYLQSGSSRIEKHKIYCPNCNTANDVEIESRTRI